MSEVCFGVKEEKEAARGFSERASRMEENKAILDVTYLKTLLQIGVEQHHHQLDVEL